MMPGDIVADSLTISNAGTARLPLRDGDRRHERARRRARRRGPRPRMRGGGCDDFAGAVVVAAGTALNGAGFGSAAQGAQSRRPRPRRRRQRGAVLPGDACRSTRTTPSRARRPSPRSRSSPSRPRTTRNSHVGCTAAATRHSAGRSPVPGRQSRGLNRARGGAAMRILAAATAGLRRFLDLLLIGLVVIVLVGILLAKLVPLTGRQTIIVGGSSMEPAIGLGAAIVIRRSPPRHSPSVTSSRCAPARRAPSSPTGSSRSSTARTAAGSGRRATPTRLPTRRSSPRRRSWAGPSSSIPFAGYLLALLSIPAGVLFLVGLAATLLASAWLLESLELDRATKVTVTLVPGADRGQGEPIAARPARRDLAIDGGFLAGAKLSRTEQLACHASVAAASDNADAEYVEADDSPVRLTGNTCANDSSCRPCSSPSSSWERPRQADACPPDRPGHLDRLASRPTPSRRRRTSPRPRSA